ncbi:10192_t:CDS:2 [Funneliformis mosseae]|uniref:10192_t:CDS:1 n=1 Tax=Funneliformis mosseae TaxID=27381 RepID=A0A9N9BEQ8_FUNMO|nr:10192_t:CDS:2 [Funneliformis mosseae]
MKVNPLPLDKEKDKEVLQSETTLVVTAEQNDYPEKSPQTKVFDITDLIFDRFDSFSGVALAKHPED